MILKETYTENELADYRRQVHAVECRKRANRCDSCGKRNPLHQHELFERSLTMGNSVARFISYHPELCAFLCADCHAEAGAKRSHYLKRNKERYGQGVVDDLILDLGFALVKDMSKYLEDLNGY